MDRRDALKNTGLLMGVTFSMGTLSNLMQSCQETPRVSWEPKFFNEIEAPVISAITEAILPKTATAGAQDMKVDIFVDLMFNDALSPADQAHVKTGYAQFVDTTIKMFNKSFTLLNPQEQQQVLERVGNDTNSFNPKIWGSTLGIQPTIDFYRRVRQFTLLGYFTSQEIATGEST